MRAFYCDDRPLPLPPEHRFPLEKYALLRRRLLEERLIDPAELRPAPEVELALVRAVHAPEYVDAFLAGTLSRDAVRRLGFPWSPEFVTRSMASVGGTLAAARAALNDGVAGNLAGGTHHAHREFGSGYCAFNDIAVAAVALLREERVERVLVVDLDVHHGDGTAAIFEGDERVFTLSLFGARNFPARKPPGDLDVPLADGTADDEYLAALEPALDEAWERARPDVVFFQAGVDALAEDRLGRLSLSLAGLAARDACVTSRCAREGVPLVLTLGGGYSVPIERTIEAHLGTYRVAARAPG